MMIELFIVAVTVVSAAGMLFAENFRIPTGERQLFVDDFGVASITALTRTMHCPEKQGAVIRGPQIRSVPNWDPEKKRYLLSTLKGLYDSADGLHFVPADPDMPARIDCVVFDPTAPERSERFKGLAPAPSGVVPAVSEDGVAFRKLDVPVISSCDEYNFSFDAQAGLFIATVKHGGPFGRSVWLSTSRDFRTWTKPEMIFHADQADQDLGREHIRRCFADPMRRHPAYNNPEHYVVDVYNMGVFRYEGVYIGMPSMFHHTGKVDKDWPGFEKMALPPETLKLVRRHGDYTGFHHVQLACSRDLKTWRRLGDRRPFIDLSPLDAGAYDTQTIMPPSAPVVRGDELWFYYTGARHYENTYTHESDRSLGVCLAVLRRDGFVSLDADKEEGSVLTKPFLLAGETLFVNVDAKGMMRVDVLDKAGKVAASSREVTGDHVRTEIAWKTGALTAYVGKPVCLRFTLRNAAFYSYWLQ